MFEVLSNYKMKLNPYKCAFGVSSGKFLGFMVNWRGVEAKLDKIKVVIEMESPRAMKEVQRLTGRIAALNCFVSRATDKCLPFRILKKAFSFEWSLECQEAFQCLKAYLSQPLILSKPRSREDLYMYLAILDAATSSVPIREESDVQMLTYYVSHSMVLAKTRYPNLKKLALALLVALRKL